MSKLEARQLITSLVEASKDDWTDSEVENEMKRLVDQAVSAGTTLNDKVFDALQSSADDISSDLQDKRIPEDMIDEQELIDLLQAALKQSL